MSFCLLASASVSVAATLIPGFASSFVCKKSGVNSLRYTTTKLHGERKLHLVKNPLCVKPTKGWEYSAFPRWMRLHADPPRESSPLQDDIASNGNKPLQLGNWKKLPLAFSQSKGYFKSLLHHPQAHVWRNITRHWFKCSLEMCL